MASKAIWNPSLWEAAGGQLPNGWRLTPFGELLESPNSMAVGVMYPGSHDPRGVPLIRVGDVQAGGVVSRPEMHVTAEVHYEYRRTALKGDELLITLVGKPGVCVVARPEMKGWNVARALAVARLKSPSLRPYLKAVLESSVMKSIVLGMLNTTVQPTLNLKEIRSLPVPIPHDVSAAESIGAVAELFNQRIDVLRQTNATLESIAQALFKSWFIDFDPVRAKAEGREPEGMDAATAALFPSEFEESELGLIPKGWAYAPFGQLLASAIGGDWGSDEPSETCPIGAAIVRGTDMPDIRQGGYGRVPRRFVNPKKAEKRTLKDGDIVIEVSGGSKTQPTGRSLYVTDSVLKKLGGVVVPTSFCRLFRPRDAHTGLLLAQHLDAIYAAGKMWNYQVQSTGLANFQTRHFLDSEHVVDAPGDILRAFHGLVRPLVDKAAGAPIAELSHLRDTLLPLLISGRVCVPEAQAQLGEAIA